MNDKIKSHDEWLIEAMCRAACEVHDRDPDRNWKEWENVAKVHLAMDRVMRGLGDRLAYDELIKNKEIK